MNIFHMQIVKIKGRDFQKTKTKSMMGHDGEQTERRAWSGRAVKDERKAGDDSVLQFSPAVWKMQPLKVKRIRSFTKEVRKKPWGKKYNLFWKKKGGGEKELPGEQHTFSVF